MYKYSLLAIILLLSSINNLVASVADPEQMQNVSQTRNNMGMTFPNLGKFDDLFVGDVQKVDAEKANEGRILLLGDGYGRLGMKALRESLNSRVIINDLSAENLAPLRTKLQLMRGGADDDRRLQERSSTVAGDCLKLQENTDFLTALGNNNPFNTFHVIGCSNVIHFFDGQQTLEFFVNAANMLAPGGKLHLLTHMASHALPLTQDALLWSLMYQNFREIYLHYNNEISRIARNDNSILFPGLIDDHWFEGKSRILDQALHCKPNGLGLVNNQVSATLGKIAQAVGLVLELNPYHINPEMRNGVYMARECSIDEAMYVGFVFSKPAESNAIVQIEDLDADLVQACVDSKEIIQNLINDRIEFSGAYPFVREKQ